MIPFNELQKLKYGDYIELQKAGDLYIGRIINIHEHKYYIEESKIVLATVVPRFEDIGQLVWTFELLRTYMRRKIESSMEKKWIKLLYE